jgi:CelD/BcsL family acetyltransferase involved in cellulose biosynthesis
MPEILEINDISALEPYRQPWHRLLAETRGASFFQTPEWLETYWKYYGAEQKLRLLIVLDGGEPCGIVPLCVAREQTKLGRLRVLTYPLHDWGSFYGPIGRDTTASLTLAMQHVAHTRRDWELIDFRYVAGDSVDVARTPAALEAAGIAARESFWKETALVDMTMGWEQYWASRESKVRNNLRRHLKRIAEAGQVELVRHRPLGAAQDDCDPRYDLYDQCVAVAKISWQGTSVNGTTLSHPGVRDYFREMHAVAARLGCLDMNLLTVNGQAIGFGYNYIYNGMLEGIRIGYDPQYAKAGAGNVLYLQMFQDSFARGDRLFDMGIGSLDVKRFWWTHTAKSYRYTHYPLTAPRAQLLRLKHWLFGSNIQTEVPLSDAQLAT